MSLEEASKLTLGKSGRICKTFKSFDGKHVEAMLEMMDKGAVTFDYGNNIRQVAKDEGVTMHLISLDLFLHIFVRSFVKEKDLFAG